MLSIGCYERQAYLGLERGGSPPLSGREQVEDGVDEPDFEERWTAVSSSRTSGRASAPARIAITAPHTYLRAGRYTVAVKVIDIFGNDTMTLVPVSVS
jgi:site-specific DNA-methyltransferase (adenine-specific)/adenine-specific DNA-methyltransferase